MRLYLLIGLVLFSIILCGCKALQKSTTGGDEAVPGGPDKGVLAKGKGLLITEKDMEERIGMMPPRRRSRFQTPRGKKNLIKAMVDTELLYAECRKKDLDKDEKILRRMEEFKKNQAILKLRGMIIEGVTVDEPEIRAEYESKIDRYKTPKRVKVSQIVFMWDEDSSPEQIADQERKARDVMERARKGEDFATLAREYSLDQESAKKGGDIGFVGRGNVPPYVLVAAMAFEKEGDISDLVKGKREIRILKATEIIPQKTKPLEEVKPWLERTLLGKKKRDAWKEYLENLRSDANVEIYEESIIKDENKGLKPVE